MSASALRLLLLGTVGLSGVVLAFLLGARAGHVLDRVTTFSGAPALQAPAALTR